MLSLDGVVEWDGDSVGMTASPVRDGDGDVDVDDVGEFVGVGDGMIGGTAGGVWDEVTDGITISVPVLVVEEDDVGEGVGTNMVGNTVLIVGLGILRGVLEGSGSFVGSAVLEECSPREGAAVLGGGLGFLVGRIVPGG